MTPLWSPGPVLIAGPCVLEHDAVNLRIGEALAALQSTLGLRVVYKASFDKANRSRQDGHRGPGLDDGLRLLERVKQQTGLPVLTDIHEPAQAAAAAAVADALQIPAFLCRQTDLIEAAGRTGLPVNIKKGQWMEPEAMAGAADKARAAGASEVAVTERGTFFGYGDLIVDMRSFPRLARATGAPIFFDATHVAQQPGRGVGGESGGDRTMVPVLLLAAAAAGADGFFLETHPDPAKAPSDRATMWPLDELANLVERALDVWSRRATASGVPA